MITVNRSALDVVETDTVSFYGGAATVVTIAPRDPASPDLYLLLAPTDGSERQWIRYMTTDIIQVLLPDQIVDP